MVASALWRVPTVSAAILRRARSKFVAGDCGELLDTRWGASLAPAGHLREEDPRRADGKGQGQGEAILEGSFIVKVVETEPKSN